MRAVIHTDGLKGALKRSRASTKALVIGKPIRAEKSITFESPSDMAKALSKERIRLIQTTRSGEFSVTSLAKKLGRDQKSVRRDITQLSDLGLIRTVTKSNPGHGRVTVIKPVAKKLQFLAVV